jgi:hypothetical protein
MPYALAKPRYSGTKSAMNPNFPNECAIGGGGEKPLLLTISTKILIVTTSLVELLLSSEDLEQAVLYNTGKIHLASDDGFGFGLGDMVEKLCC